MICRHFRLVTPVRLLLLLGAVLVAAACNRNDDTHATGLQRLPAGLVLTNLVPGDSHEIRAETYDGRVLLVLALRTDDTAFRDSMPTWNTLLAELEPAGFSIVGVAVDDRPAATLAAEAAELNANFPIGHADESAVTLLGGAPAIRAIPTSFLFDRDGIFLRTYSGYETLDTYLKDISAALEGLPLPSLSAETEE